MLEIMEINSLNILLPENVTPQLINSTNVIVDAIKELGNQSFIIGNELVKIRDSKSYLPAYKSITDYGEQVFGFKKSAIYSFMKIADLFLNEQGEIDSPQMQGMNFSQLESLTSLKENEINELFSEGIINPDTPTKEIKNAVKNYKERKKAIKALTDKGFSPEVAAKTIDKVNEIEVNNSEINQSTHPENETSETIIQNNDFDIITECENGLPNLSSVIFFADSTTVTFKGIKGHFSSRDMEKHVYKYLLTAIMVKLQNMEKEIGD